MIPGDIFGLHAFLLRAMDHSVCTLVPTRLAAISCATVFDLFEHHPRIGAALWWSALQQEAINRERIVALGRRSARGRVAYLLCELVWRLRAVGLGEDDAIQLPLTQAELADALGLTPVHINRILQEMRRNELITLAHHRLRLRNVERLQEIAGFNQDYLLFGGELCAKVGDGLTGRRRRIVGVFEPPLLQQRSDTPCPMLTSSSCFNQGRSPTRLPRCCATERAPCWPKRSRPRWPNSSPSMSI
jgi:transcriptional regulator with XRE-family HTH domain